MAGELHLRLSMPLPEGLDGQYNCFRTKALLCPVLNVPSCPITAIEVHREITEEVHLMHMTWPGAMTAADMESLFQPVPFGDTGYESPLTQVTAPDISPIWDLFRNINEEKQNKTLEVVPPK